MQDGEIRRLAGPLTRQQSQVLASHDLAAAMEALGPVFPSSSSSEPSAPAPAPPTAAARAPSSSAAGMRPPQPEQAPQVVRQGDGPRAYDDSMDISFRSGTHNVPHQPQPQQAPPPAAAPATAAGRVRAATDGGDRSSNAAEAFGIAGLQVGATLSLAHPLWIMRATPRYLAWHYLAWRYLAWRCVKCLDPYSNQHACMHAACMYAGQGGGKGGCCQRRWFVGTLHPLRA